MYLIITIMIAGIILSAAMLLPYPTRFRRKACLAEHSEEEEIIECEYSNWKLWILRGLALVVMAVAAEQIYDACEAAADYFAMCLLYIAAFVLHYLIYLKLDKKFYFSSKGFWAETVSGMPVPYEQIEVIKAWKTTAPFTGCHGNLKLRIQVQAKRSYTITVPREEAGDEAAACQQWTDQQKILAWLPKSGPDQFTDEKKNGLKRIGIIIAVIGTVMVIVFGILTCLGIGIGNSLQGDEQDYKTVLDEEQALRGTIDAIYEDEKGQLYALFRNFACVNVYDDEGTFLYAYKVPKGQKGSFEFAVQEPYVYIKNKDDIVYVYKEKQFLNKVPLKELFDQTQLVFIADGENPEKSHLIRSAPYPFSGEQALPYMFAGIAVIILGLALYNKGRYSLYR
ncbi:hypothetical protein NE619_02145 [Anaerovorax odorimutans]|uniref:DUF3592 domain-containing protein n=1 Tax=Anaerovorax odorimutans TaxID=109327 RepID=A0ABT1RK11_9FIRM|nr:hypothetical protein [Anaerovorax odorimutans]MCQ4635517.1 hypothetical protein [Anaerovorax odorimutans]